MFDIFSSVYYSTTTSIWGTGKAGSVKNFKVPKKRRTKIEQLEESGRTKGSLENTQADMVPVPPTMAKQHTNECASEERGQAIEASQASTTTSSANWDNEIYRECRVEDTIYQKTGQEVIEDSLADGNFNEDESHALFLEALKAWRGGGKEDDVRMTDADEHQQPSTAAAAIEVQTEPPDKTIFPSKVAFKTRPVSARSSYFFKKVALTQAASKAQAAVMGR